MRNKLSLTVKRNPPCYQVEAEFIPNERDSSPKKVYFAIGNDRNVKCVKKTVFCFWTEGKRTCSLLVIYGDRSVRKAKRVELESKTRKKVTFKVAKKFKEGTAAVKYWADPKSFEDCDKLEPVDFVKIKNWKKYDAVLWLAEPRMVGLQQGGGTEHVAIIIDDSIDGGGDAENPRSRNQL